MSEYESKAAIDHEYVWLNEKIKTEDQKREKKDKPKPKDIDPHIK